jgi:hypothetical protein
MGYYVRAFCKSSDVPAIGDVLRWLDGRGCRLWVDDPEERVDLDSADWEEIALKYKDGKLPILVECNRDEGAEGCLMKQEVKEFLEFIGKPGLSLAKRRVIKHLRDTRFTVACRLLSGDIDDDGFDANGEFLRYFVENCGGMIQADDEGFYEGSTIVVELKR